MRIKLQFLRLNPQILRANLQFLQVAKRVALEPTRDFLHRSNFFRKKVTASDRVNRPYTGVCLGGSVGEGIRTDIRDFPSEYAIPQGIGTKLAI